MKNKTLVIGASENPERYSYKAVLALRQYDHPVAAIGNRAGKIIDVDISTERLPYDDIDTITLYINPQIQKDFYNYILSLKPRRILFNPGTENEELMDLAEDAGIQPITGCTLVMLHTGQY
jgi:predicted CoA-binding protein